MIHQNEHGASSSQEQLEQFYRTWKAQVPDNLPEFEDLKGPDLISLDQQYLRSSPRIVIIGQQQNGWNYTYPQFIKGWTLSDALTIYRTFDFGLHYPSTPFWRFFHAVRLAAFPNEPEQRRKVLWSNLVKFVSKDGYRIDQTPYGAAALALQTNLLTTELSIAKPDVCIFVTGPSYDDILRRYYPDIAFQPFDVPTRQFAKLSHPNLPQHSYRCYHPNYLNRNLEQRWDKVFGMLRHELAWPAQA